jgi:nitrite reductase/ring-hydroxylating ferredoxin subunit
MFWREGLNKMADEKELSGVDFADGVSPAEFSDGGMLQGHTKGEPILVARCAGTFFAIGASCTHYGAPLAKGLLVDDTVRCPWHHACFSLRTGEAFALRRSTRLAPGRLRSLTANSSCAKSSPRKSGRPGP